MNWLQFRAQYGYAKEALEKKEWEKAKFHFEKALSISPSKADALLGLAEAHVNLNEKNAAVKILETLIQDEPDFAYPYFMLGKILNEKEKFDQCLALEPKNAEAWHELGKLYLHTNDQKNAIQAFSKATLLEPWICISRLEDVRNRLRASNP